jgi:hypothetical protein
MTSETSSDGGRLVMREYENRVHPFENLDSIQKETGGIHHQKSQTYAHPMRASEKSNVLIT